MDFLTFIFRLIDLAFLGLMYPILAVGCYILQEIGTLVPTLLDEFLKMQIITTFTDNIKKLQPYMLTLCIMIVLASTIINLRFDQVKHVVKRTLHIGLWTLLIPIIFAQGINLVSTVSQNMGSLVSNNSLLENVTNSLIYENPSWSKQSAEQCKGKNTGIFNFAIPNPFNKEEELIGFHWPEEGTIYDGSGDNYVQGVNIPFFPNKENVHQQWRSADLEPSNLKNVFPNDDGEPFPKGGSKGIIKKGEGINELGLRYYSTACAVGAAGETGQGVVMKWSMVNYIVFGAVSSLMLIVAGMVVFKILEQIYEVIMLGIFLPLTNILSISEMGLNIFKSHLTQFGLALAEIPLTIIIAQIGVMFMVTVFAIVPQLTDTVLKGLFGDPVSEGVKAIQNISLQNTMNSLLYIVLLIWAIKIIGKGPQRLSKVFESNLGTSSTMSGIVGSIAQTVAQTAFSVAMYRSGGKGGMPKGSPEGDIPDRPDSGVSSGLEESSTGGGSVDAYSSANRSTDSVSGDIAPTIDDANQTATRNTNVVDTTTATHNGADSPYAGMTNEQRTSYVNNNVVQTNNVTSNNVVSGNSTLDSRPSFNPDDYNGAK